MLTLLIGSDISGVCLKRTVLRQNAYLEEFLPVLQHDGTIAAVLNLSISYLLQCLPETSRQRYRELKARLTAITASEVYRELQKPSRAYSTSVTAALLLHDATLNPEQYGPLWNKYLYPIRTAGNAPLHADLAQASVAILARCATRLTGWRQYEQFDLTWVKQGTDAELTEINSTLGISRHLLGLIDEVITITKQLQAGTAWPEVASQGLISGIEATTFWVASENGEQAIKIATMTAESYREGAMLYALARVDGYVRFGFLRY